MASMVDERVLRSLGTWAIVAAGSAACSSTDGSTPDRVSALNQPATLNDPVMALSSCYQPLDTPVIAFVDIFDVSRQAKEDPTLVANDGLHPSGRQYGLWVERIAPVVARLIGRA